MNPLDSSPAARRIAYTVLFVVGGLLGATQVAYASLEAGQPGWLTAALAVYAFVGSYLGLTARRNTSGQ